LLPSSEIARPELAERLRERGADVTTVTAYRTVTGEGGLNIPGMLADQQIDALTFCSPSAVDGFVTRFEREGGPLSDAMLLPVACIGPTTLDSAREHGFASAISAERQTLEGLVGALDQMFSPRLVGDKHWQ
jgi:uroporphyrinogen III methyltransferase / synthase